MKLLREVGIVVGVPKCDSTMNCSVFEDDNGAIEKFKAPKIRPRTKYDAIKYQYYFFSERNFALIEKEDSTE